MGWLSGSWPWNLQEWVEAMVRFAEVEAMGVPIGEEIVI